MKRNKTSFRTGTISQIQKIVGNQLCFRVDPIDMDINDLIGGNYKPAKIDPPSETPEAKVAREAIELEAKTKADVEVKRIADEAEAKRIAEGGQHQEPQGVEIDGKKFNLNDKGDAINGDGSIFKTKAELDALEVENQVPPLIEELQQKAGFSITGENGQPKVYEDTPEGILDYAKDLGEYYKKESERQLFKALPDAELYIKHRLAGGDPKDFFNIVRNDYSKIVYDDKNIDQHKQLVKEYLAKKGFSEEKINRNIKLLEDSSQLAGEAKDALGELVTNQKAETKKLADDAKIRQEAQEKETNNYWTEVQTIVSTGKLNNVIIPEADRVPFFEYISKAVTEEGYSQAQVDAYKESKSTSLLNEFYRFKKYDVSKIVRDSVNKDKVTSLRTRITRSNGDAGGGLENRNIANTSKPDISLDSLMS